MYGFSQFCHLQMMRPSTWKENRIYLNKFRDIFYDSPNYLHRSANVLKWFLIWDTWSIYWFTLSKIFHLKCNFSYKLHLAWRLGWFRACTWRLRIYQLKIDRIIQYDCSSLLISMAKDTFLGTLGFKDREKDRIGSFYHCYNRYDACWCFRVFLWCTLSKVTHWSNFRIPRWSIPQWRRAVPFLVIIFILWECLMV